MLTILSKEVFSIKYLGVFYSLNILSALMQEK